MVKKIGIALLLAALALLAACGSQAASSGEDAELLALMTDGYRDRSVEEFNRDFAPVRDLYTGYGLNHPQAHFMQTLLYSSMELLYGEDGIDPSYASSAAAENAQVDLLIQWSIPDPSALTVGERDDALNGRYQDAMELLEEVTREEWESEGFQESIQEQLDAICESLPTEGIAVRIWVEQVEFQ